MQSGDPIESQYERESRLEMYVTRIIDRKYEANPTLSRLYSTFKDRRTIPFDVTWEKMKSDYGWGYAKGSRIDPLVTWIYIRPDIKNALKKLELTIDTVVKSLRLNEHYFIVEKKAIAFLKSHCSRVQYDRSVGNRDESSDEENVLIFIIIIY